MGDSLVPMFEHIPLLLLR